VPSVIADDAAAPSAPRDSVVIPAYKKTELLLAAVRSAIGQDMPPDHYEVIVVDSSPDERNLDAVEALRGQAACALRCYRKQPEGPGPSRTMGAKEARGEIVAFMDSDCEATPGWLRAGLAAFSPDVGLVQGRVLPEPGVPTGVLTFYVIVEAETPFYETANMFYRRDALLAGGGFTADLHPLSDQPMGGEDTRAAWHMKRNGWRSRFAGDALVYHEVRRIPIWKWFLHKRMYMLPPLVREIPELREHCYLRYFFDRSQAALCLALVGLVAATVHPATIALAIPYVYLRASEPSKTLRGVFKIARAALYFPRDLTTLAVLAYSSARHFSLLL
jgi:glycosyltransferase involved in cell wall biosynthesis